MSQFDGLLSVKKNQQIEPKSKPQPKPRTDKISTDSPSMPSLTTATKLTGKSRDTEYTQTSVYIKKETQTAVKKVLLDDAQGRDFSELVEELLVGWVKENR
jgi:hypothetical protein